MKGLPDEYQPKVLRPPPQKRRKTVAYVRGFRSGNGITREFPASTDPFVVLEWVPSEGEQSLGMPIIVRLNKDGSQEVLYVWHIHHQKWVLEKGSR